MVFMVIICCSFWPCSYLKLPYVFFITSGACYSAIQIRKVVCTWECSNQEMHGQYILSHLFYIHHSLLLSASIYSVCQFERTEVKGEEMGEWELVKGKQREFCCSIQLTEALLFYSICSLFLRKLRAGLGFQWERYVYINIE